jgi:hypothetical protein
MHSAATIGAPNAFAFIDEYRYSPVFSRGILAEHGQ